MARTGLDGDEVSVIKAMLARGMPNAAIQFYFNTPQRPVNNGRISEIKSGYRWGEVAPATQFELDEFLETHPLTISARTAEDPVLPVQLKAASEFTVLDNGLVDLKSDQPSSQAVHDDAVLEIYGELKHKVLELKNIGHNGLGEVAQQVDRLESALPPNIGAASVTRIWIRGNSLKASLRAHDAAGGLQDFHPAKLDPLCAERLRDVVEMLNLFIANDPKGVLLDQLSLGPQNRDKHVEALQAIKNVIDAANKIATPAATEALTEQTQCALVAPEGESGNQVIALGTNTTLNFLFTIIKSSFWHIGKVVGKDLSAVWKAARLAGYTAAGIATVNQIPTIMSFLSENAPAIANFLNAVGNNPTLQNILQFILSFT